MWSWTTNPFHLYITDCWGVSLKKYFYLSTLYPSWSCFLFPFLVLGYFLGDTKAVLNGCDDHWTLQDKASFPLLYKMTVCMNIRVVLPGAWIAFTYSSIHGLMPELGLEGDDGALYAWLLRVKHRFPLKLSLQDWHQVCLRRNVVGSSFSLEVHVTLSLFYGLICMH